MDDTSLLNLVTERLREEGGRMTNQRRLILETLEYCPDHPTAEEIYNRARLHDPSLHLSTVYRTLRWLEEEGFVSTRFFEDERRQERFDPVSADSLDHYHFRCRVCNEIIEFAEPQLEILKKTFEKRFDAKVENATLVFYGVCSRCQELNQ